jgi:hypothetical protein
MDKYLENLVSELGAAINEAIQFSDKVSETMERIHATGHDVLLALEVVAQENDLDEPLQYRDRSIEDRLSEISSEDRKFLRSLNIKFDSDE